MARFGSALSPNKRPRNSGSIGSHVSPGRKALGSPRSGRAKSDPTYTTTTHATCTPTQKPLPPRLVSSWAPLSKRSQREKTKRRCLASSPSPSLPGARHVHLARPLVRRRRRFPARPPAVRRPRRPGPPRGRPLGPPRRQGNRRLSLDRSSVSRRSAGHAIASRRGAFSIPLRFGLGLGGVFKNMPAPFFFSFSSFFFRFLSGGEEFLKFPRFSGAARLGFAVPVSVALVWLHAVCARASRAVR